MKGGERKIVALKDKLVSLEMMEKGLDVLVSRSQEFFRKLGSEVVATLKAVRKNLMGIS
jgi:hypothetical protein